MSRILLALALHRPLSAMDGTVTHNPKDTTGIVVGRPRHHWFDPPIKRRDSVFGLTPAENSGRVDIQGTEVNPSSAALVSILDASGTTRLARLGGMKSAAGLNARLLLCGNHEFIGL